MVLALICRLLIALVLLTGVIVSFAIGVIGVNDMCGNNQNCPWNPSPKVVASYATGGVLCVLTLVFIVYGFVIESCDSSHSLDDEYSYDSDCVCIHGVTYLIIFVIFAVIVILMTIIYYAMPRTFDQGTLLFFLTVIHLIGGFSITWAFVPLCSCDCKPSQDNCCVRAQKNAKHRRETNRINAEARRLEAQNRLAIQNQTIALQSQIK
jgi:hypothetical protein